MHVLTHPKDPQTQPKDAKWQTHPNEYMCVCVCVCVWERERERERERRKRKRKNLNT